jgi:hypothetical protein
MTEKEPEPIFDEGIIKYKLKKYIQHPKKRMYFNVLYNLFFVQKLRHVRILDVQFAALCPTYENMRQRLKSFVILNLLEYIKVPKKNKLVYVLKNPEWWVEIYNDLNGKGEVKDVETKQDIQATAEVKVDDVREGNIEP